jgi:hypothetical protein
VLQIDRLVCDCGHTIAIILSTATIKAIAGRHQTCGLMFTISCREERLS